MTRATEIEDVPDLIREMASVRTNRIMTTGITSNSASGNPTHMAALAWGPWLVHALHTPTHNQLLDFEVAQQTRDYQRILTAMITAAQRRTW